MTTKKAITHEEKTELLATLRKRFEENMQRHEGIQWSAVEAKLTAAPDKLWTLYAMEKTAGEPDVVGYNSTTNEYVFHDCSEESPADRRSLCYDKTAWDSRKANKPIGNAVDTAASMGIELLTEADYRHLQSLGEFDLKTSSWIVAPDELRKLGGAIFGDRRFGRVFVYHNSAESYYGARGFRGKVRV